MPRKKKPVEPNGYLFFQMPKSKYFGIVPKEFWEKHHHMDDQCALHSLLRAGFPMQDFGEPMEGHVSHDVSYKKGLKRLLEMGFTEIPNPWPENDEDETGWYD